MGLMLAEPGFHTRCFVEWEPYPRQAIIAAQRAKYFAPAPIWDDVTTFDGRPLRGAIDTILAGYPCQPFSAAGQRRGADDERHLWPDVARIIREVEPRWVFLENVAGHISLGAETVLRELWDMGWTPAAGAFSAAEVGASHERLRWFCVAHRDTDADAGRLDGGRADRSAEQGQGEGQERERLWAGAGGGCGGVESAECPEWWQGNAGGDDYDEPQGRWVKGPSGIGASSAAMADASGARAAPRSAEPERGQQGIADQPIDDCRPIFPPGPGAMAEWQAILAGPHDDLAPAVGVDDILARALRRPAVVQEASNAALEPVVRRMADGLAARSRALRLLGNGVCPLAAANAWRALSHAHGLGTVDLDAASAPGSIRTTVPDMRGTDFPLTPPERTRR
jgi:DNA (cytosine-5)-methyltransferase 1